MRVYEDKEKYIVIEVWDISDVRKSILERNIRFKSGEELTDTECNSVLEKADQYYDRYEGMNCDIIEYWIYKLYRKRILSVPSTRSLGVYVNEWTRYQ